jgi:hypothetical protein
MDAGFHRLRHNPQNYPELNSPTAPLAPEPSGISLAPDRLATLELPP